MNGACQRAVVVDDVRRRVGGALSRPAKCASGGVRRERPAPRPRRARAIEHERDADARVIARRRPRHSLRARIDERERDVREQRAEGEEQRAGAGAAGDQIDVARAQRVEHQPAEARPRGDHFDGERSAEQRADDQAVDRGDRPQRRLERVAPDDARSRDAAGERREHERLRRSLRSSPAPAAARTSRRAAAPAPAPARPGGAADRATRAAAGAVGRAHAADRQPAGARRDEHQEQRRQQRRHRQQHERRRRGSAPGSGAAAARCR